MTVTEGNAGTVNAVFTVTLSAASGQTVTVNFATANGTATAGSDYVAASGTLTFNPGTTTQTITVQVNGDTLIEGDETFFVNLSGATNATIADGQGVGTIIDDDPPPVTFRLSVSVRGSGTVTSDPSGIICPTDCEQDYPSETVVTLTATPARGWRFAGWRGACSGKGTCVVTMTADRSVTAIFIRSRR